MIEFSTPVQGLQAATAKLNATASRIASVGNSSSGDSVNLSAELLALLEAKYATAANVQVAQTMDEISKSVLNIVG